MTKKFIWDENEPPIVYRPGTSDEAIIKTVLVDRQEYVFPRMEPKIVFDIGGNIGVLAVILAKIYPMAKIHSFEPVMENHELLVENTKHLSNVVAHFYGIGGETGTRRIWNSLDPNNHGGFSIAIRNDCGKGEIINVKDVAEIISQHGMPEVIKIDVEGAEAEIFEAMPSFDGLKWISGELHGVRDFHALDILSKHFHISCVRGFQDKVWHFHAVSKTIDLSHGNAQND